MSNSVSSPHNLPADLSELTQAVNTAAQNREGNCLALLELLRLLNTLHSDIRDTLFRDALPDNRQRLYRLLRDIEQQGGWPYIKRMQLTALLEHLAEFAEDSEVDAGRVQSVPESYPDS
ncbi:hypothetical protein [Leptolyngbya sp. BC1307]|uniref:hypothetical protein n=1 Tax=Leptolyngbya sp. BC1307 TaxID=2029589 RepID=UPI000EFB1D93|nr:hypothetical protein [Leptolyngbya sp. BC1307]